MTGWLHGAIDKTSLSVCIGHSGEISINIECVSVNKDYIGPDLPSLRKHQQLIFFFPLTARSLSLFALNWPEVEIYNITYNDLTIICSMNAKNLGGISRHHSDLLQCVIIGHLFQNLYYHLLCPFSIVWCNSS